MNASADISVGAATIIVIRHAEKTREPGDLELSEIGRRRAAVLAQALPIKFGRIDAIIAAKSSAKSLRPLRTVQPLALMLKKPVLEHWDSHEYAALANALASDDTFNGKHVVVCWRHKCLHNLAMALGAPPLDPRPESDYEHMFVVRRRPEYRFFWYRQVLDGKELRIIESEQY